VHDILIIGGGLSGLALAKTLSARGQSFHLLEARDRLGGRILNEHHGGAAFDMGPAWFWPGQPRIAALTTAFGLTRFEQFAEGLLTAEDAQGQVQHGRGFASMQGSYRLQGGFGALIDALAADLPRATITRQAEVTQLQKHADHINVTASDGRTWTARQVVLALPPRIAATLTYAPALPAAALSAMQNIPTWMAGQAKAIAIYDTAFWRDNGLSGDAHSRHGPMVEIHDASPADAGPFALFGFLGVPPVARQDTALLHDAVLTLSIKDWAFDPWTATTADHAPLTAHPAYGLPSALAEIWDNALIFSGTETAPQFGGFLEGALEAAEIAADMCSPQ